MSRIVLTKHILLPDKFYGFLTFKNVLFLHTFFFQFLIRRLAEQINVLALQNIIRF